MAIKKIEHIGLMVSNIERSIAFYMKVLGMKHLRTVPHSSGVFTFAYMSFPDAEETVLELVQVQGYSSELPAEGKVHHIGFTVTDIEQEFQRIKDLPEVELKDEQPTILPDGSKVFLICGPDGELLELFQPGEIAP